MKRRQFITLLGGAAAAAWPLAVRAQQGGAPAIGLLWPGDAPPVSPRMESFRQGLRAAGFVDGQNVAIELRYAQKGPQQLPELAAELVRSKVDVIFTGGDLAARTAQQATGTIPIVALSDDILGAGLIASLSRPGGNITGLSFLAPELSAKRLELLRDLIPNLSRVAALHDPTNGTSQVTMAQSAAVALNVKLQVLDVKHRDDVAVAIRAARDAQAQALNVFFSPLLSSLYREIVAFAAEYKIPAIYQWKEHVEAGGLASYGVNLAAMWRQGAVITAKVLKGAFAVLSFTTSSNFVGCSTGRSAGFAARPRHPAVGPLARRRGGRIDRLPCCDCSQPLMADSSRTSHEVREVGESGHWSGRWHHLRVHALTAASDGGNPSPCGRVRE